MPCCSNTGSQWEAHRSAIGIWRAACLYAYAWMPSTSTGSSTIRLAACSTHHLLFHEKKAKTHRISSWTIINSSLQWAARAITFAHSTHMLSLKSSSTTSDSGDGLWQPTISMMVHIYYSASDHQDLYQVHKYLYHAESLDEMTTCHKGQVPAGRHRQCGIGGHASVWCWSKSDRLQACGCLDDYRSWKYWISWIATFPEWLGEGDKYVLMSHQPELPATAAP